ncbi:hypothetical protein BJ741DRAFT_257624 [Chytriomyces cf. hyalinus JEL632]|nr:hypothetical protein BJ741DRAFT_257624 [Chytriomyces cf. hyalinus JEL632]
MREPFQEVPQKIPAITKSRFKTMLAEKPTFVIPPRKASVGVADEPANSRHQRPIAAILGTSSPSMASPRPTQPPHVNAAERGYDSTLETLQAVPVRTTSSKRRDVVLKPSNSIKSNAVSEPGTSSSLPVHIPTRGRSRSKPEPITRFATKELGQKSGSDSVQASTISALPPFQIPPRRTGSPHFLLNKPDFENGIVSISQRTTSKKSESGSSKDDITREGINVIRPDSIASMTSILDAYAPSRSSSEADRTSLQIITPVRTRSPLSSMREVTNRKVSVVKTADVVIPVQIPVRQREYASSMSVTDSVLTATSIEQTLNRKSFRSLSVDTHPMMQTDNSTRSQTRSTRNHEFSEDAAEAMRESVASLQESILAHLRRSVVHDLKLGGFGIGSAFRASMYSSVCTDEAHSSIFVDQERSSDSIYSCCNETRSSIYMDKEYSSVYSHAEKPYSSMYAERAYSHSVYSFTQDPEHPESLCSATLESKQSLVIPKRGESSNVAETATAAAVAAAAESDGSDALQEHHLDPTPAAAARPGSERYSFIEGGEDLFEVVSLSSGLSPEVGKFLPSFPNAAESDTLAKGSGGVFMGSFQMDVMRKLRIVRKMMDDAKLNAVSGLDGSQRSQRKGSADNAHSGSLQRLMRGRKGSESALA